MTGISNQNNTFTSSTRLRSRLAGDFLSAICAGFVATPFVAMVDKAIVVSASSQGKKNLGSVIVEEMCAFVAKPASFIRRPEFFMVWGVYGATYLAANWIDTGCDELKMDKTLPKLFGVTGTNVVTCIAKDRAFAQIYGTGTARAMPFASYSAFIARDAITLGACFDAPDKLSARAMGEGGYFKGYMTKPQSDVFFQLACPAAVQFVTSPLHLTALDYYNHPNATLAQRCATIGKVYWFTLGARMLRLTWSFGLGGVSNKRFRKFFHAECERLLTASGQSQGFTFIGAKLANF
jgi:hypothetical protein